MTTDLLGVRTHHPARTALPPGPFSGMQHGSGRDNRERPYQ